MAKGFIQTIRDVQNDQLYRSMLAQAIKDTARYARQGEQQKEEVANTVTGSAMTSLNRGDLNNYDYSTSRRSIIDKAKAAKALSSAGIFNSPEYALNGKYSGLPELPYMQQLLEEKQMELAKSKEEDEKYQSRQQYRVNTWEKWSDMRNRLGEMTEENAPHFWAYADYLLNGNLSSPFDMDTYDSLWNEMDDKEFFATQGSLQKQFEGLDWEQLTSKEATVKDQLYKSLTPGLESDVNMLTKAIRDRETVSKLETEARADMRFGDMSIYTGNALVLGENDQYMHSDPYFFINNANIDEQTFNQATYGTRINWSTREVEQYHSPYLDLGYQYLTDDELDVYNYYYNTNPEKASQYLTALQSELLNRRAMVDQEFWETLATNKGTGWLATLSSLGMNVLNTNAAVLQGIAALQGNDNPNAAYYDWLNRQGYITGAQSEAIGELGGPELFGKTLGQHLYEGGMSGLNNLTRIAMFGPKGALAAAGVQSASNSLHETAGRDNMSGAAKVTQAVLTGLAEVGTEKIGLDALFDKGKKNAAKYLMGVIGAEQGEETLNAIGQEAIEQAVAATYGHKADNMTVAEWIEEIGQTGLQTLVSSLLLGSGGAISQANANRVTGKQVKTQGDFDSVLDIAAGMDPSTQSYQLAQEAKASAGKGKKISLNKMGQIVNALDRDLSAEQSRVVDQVMDEAIEERLVELGTDAATAKKNAPAVRKIANGQVLTAGEKRAVAWDDNASQVVKELAAKENTDLKRIEVEGAPTAEPEGQRAGQKWKSDLGMKAFEQTREVLGKRSRLADAVSTPAAQDVQNAVDAAGKKTSAKNAKSQNMTNKSVAYVTEAGEAKGEFQRFEIKDGAVHVVVKTGDKESTVKVEDLTDEGGAGTAAIIEYTATAHHNMTAAEANTMMQTYEKVGGNVKKFITDFEAVYTAGYAGIDAPATGLQDAVSGMVYEQAQREAAEAEEKRVEKAKAMRNATRGSVAWLGQVEDNSAIKGAGDQEALSGAMEGMTEEQKTTVEVIQGLAEELRVNVVLYEGKGNNLGKLANGKYEPSTHTLYIDVNSGAASSESLKAGTEQHTLGYAMMRTMGHELTHHIESTSAEFYAQYKAAVKKQLQENGQSWAELVRGKIESAAAEGRKLTRMGAEAEVVADASEYMLQESRFTKKLDSGLYAKVKSFVQSFMEKVREIFTHITGEHRESAALRKVIDGVRQYTGNLQQLWDAALGETIQGESALGDHDGDVPEMVTGAQYSMRDASEDYASAEDEDFHRNGRIYDYDFMVAQKPISVVVIPSVDTLMSDGRFSRSDVVKTGKSAILESANEKGHKKVTNVYTGRALTITNNSIRHGLNGSKQRLLANAQIGMVIGDVVKNGIPVNGLIPTDQNVIQTYAMVTPCITEDGKRMMAVTHVDIQKNEVNSVTFTDIVHSANGRIYKNSEPVSDTIDVEGHGPYHPSRYTISISDLLKDVNISFKSLLSKDVMEHLGEESPANGVYSDKVMYSSRDLPDAVSIREYLGAMKPTSRMTETEKDLLGRYQKKLAELQEKERLAAEQDEIIKTAPATSQELLQAKNRYQVYRQQANRIARELARLERAEGFAGIMATSQTMVNKYLSGATGSVADAQDALETEIKGLTDRLKVIGNTVEGTAQGQRNAFARGLFNQTELNLAAKQLKDSYNSRMSVKVIADRLALAYGEIYANKGAEGAKRFANAAKELAQDILDSSRYRYRSEMLSTIAEEVPTISLTETDLQEIKNAGLTVAEYKRGLSPYVNVAEGASDLSSYVSNAEAYGGQIGRILGDETEGNLAMALYNVIQAERASEDASIFEGMSESASLGTVLADVVSVNLPMSTSDTTLEYLRKELKKYGGENEQAAKSVDAAIKAAKNATARASAVWREAVKAQGIVRQAVEYYRALEEQRRLIELQEQKEMLTEQLKTDAAKKLGEKASKMRQEYREREQRARAYRQTRDEVNKLRRGIGRKVKRLNALRIRETDQKHVPDELKPVVDLVMAVFTENSISKLAFSEKQVMRLVRAYDALRGIDIDEAWRWDDEVSQMLKDLTELVDDYNVLTVSPEGETLSYYFTVEGVESEKNILTGVEAIVSNVLRMIDSANDNFLTQRNETFDAFATQTGEDLIHHDDAKILKGKWGDAQMALDELLRTGNMTPIYFFEQLKNGRIMEVFDQIRKAQTDYARIIRECQDFVQGVKEKHHYGSWTGDAKLSMKTSQGHQITLSREQAMWVYATAKREKSNKLYQTEHLLVGGFQYKDTADTGEGIFRATDKPHSLDEADVAMISEWLTAEQKAYADEVVGFLSTTMADYGNDASMEMFGYKKFLERYYFPYQTEAAQRFQRGDEGASGDNAGTGRVKNSGFTKKLQHKADVTLVMDDFTTVAVDHMQKMATYAAMVQPIENMKRLMNHKVIEEDGTINTIRALIGQKYGMPAQKYLQDFLKDLNGAAQGDNRATKGVDYLISAFKRGAVMASASVVLQQPTAIARAMAMVNPKHFMTNPFYRPSKGVWDEMMKHSGTAVIKDMGKFDVGLGLTASEYISDEHLKPWEAYRRLKAESKLKGGAEAYKRFMDWLTAAPGRADQWTWGLIWQAVKKEVTEQNPGVDTSSEAFLDLVGQRFDDVIDHTQVYDSVLTRSNLMRSKNALHKMATSFMSEPTLSINMLYDAFTGWKDKKYTGWEKGAIFGSVMASQVLAGAMAALVQAWNDDDDERNWLEKYADRAAGNILDNINVFGMVPYISDFISLCQGYEVERADMSVVSTLVKYTTGFWNKISKGETLTLKDWENFAGNWANLTGIPAKNIMREIRRTINAVTNTNWSAPNMTNVGYAMMENVPFYSSKNSAWYERLTKAMLDGNAELAEDLRTYMLTSKMVKTDTIDSGIKTALKNLYADGKLDEEEAKRFLTDNGLVEDEDAAYWEVDKWEWMRETGGKAGDWRKYDDFTTALESGENLKQVVQTYIDNGVTAKTLASKITEEYKPRMKELYKTNKTEFANLRARILTAYQVLGYDRDKKLKDIQKWLKEE